MDLRHQDIDAVIIDHDVTEIYVIELQLRRPIIVLRPETTSKDLIEELWQLFPDKVVRIQ